METILYFTLCALCRIKFCHAGIMVASGDLSWNTSVDIHDFKVIFKATRPTF